MIQLFKKKQQNTNITERFLSANGMGLPFEVPSIVRWEKIC